MKNWLKILLMAALLSKGAAIAQIPVEVFAGNEKATIDIMFFKFFYNKQNEPSRFLFFNRNRASVDYQMTPTESLPQFGFTEAISYNLPALKGFAPVFLAQVFNSGIYPKTGVQFVHINDKLTIFSWLVSETLKNPNIDFYLLFRYTPAISSKVKLFTHIESLNTFPTNAGNYSFIQRLRLGLKFQRFQTGLGTDLAERGKGSFDFSANSGIFLRYEF